MKPILFYIFILTLLSFSFTSSSDSFLSLAEISSVESTQEIGNGLANQVHLPNPTSLSSALDEITAQKGLDLINRGLNDFANANLMDTSSLATDISNYSKNPKVADLLNNNPQIIAILKAYQIFPPNSFNLIKKISGYALFHPLSFINDVKNLKKLFDAGQFEEFGRSSGELLQKIN